MFSLFKKKPKPLPLYKRLWNEARAAVAIVTSLCAFLSASVAYIQIDVKSFINTTNVVSVSANGHLYTKINTRVELPEMSYIIVNINNNQVTHKVYPEGIKRGEIIIDTLLPFNVKNDSRLNVSVDIVFIGLRTLFQPERLTVNLKVKQENADVKNNNSNFVVKPPIRSGIWV